MYGYCHGILPVMSLVDNWMHIDFRASQIQTWGLITTLRLKYVTVRRIQGQVNSLSQRSCTTPTTSLFARYFITSQSFSNENLSIRSFVNICEKTTLRPTIKKQRTCYCALLTRCKLTLYVIMYNFIIVTMIISHAFHLTPEPLDEACYVHAAPRTCSHRWVLIGPVCASSYLYTK